MTMHSHRWLPSLAVSLLAALTATAPAQQPAQVAPAALPAQAPLPAIVPAGRPSIGIALEGGGALGLAHIGVLQWLEEHHIPIDRISGTSMGALVGGVYATGATPQQMQALAEGHPFLSVFTLQYRYTDLDYRRRQDREQLPQAFSVGMAHGPALRNALLNERGIDEFLNSVFFSWNREELDFNRTPIPFRCVATNLNTLHAVTFSHGPLPIAVHASLAIPGVFPPVRAANGDWLVDGGIVDNLPSDVLRSELHAERVIAVHLQDAPLSSADTSSIVGVLNRAFSAGITQNVEAALHNADIVLDVPVGKFSGMDYQKATDLVHVGYQAAEAAHERLLPLALSDADWALYMADRSSRRLQPPTHLHEIQVAWGPPGAVRQAEQDLRSLQGAPIGPEPILKALRPVQSNANLAAEYSFLTPPGGSSDDPTLLVRLRPDLIGPPYLLIAPEAAATTSNINRAMLSFRLVDQNFTGYGSELRANIRVGYMTDLYGEYYRLLGHRGFYLQPSIEAIRKPVYIWQDQKRIAERFEQDLGEGMQLGRTFSPNLQISADWRMDAMRWSLRTGNDGTGYLHGTAQTAVLQLHLNQASSGTISPNGLRLDLAAGAFYNPIASSNAPLVRLSASRTHSWHEDNIFGLSAELNSYLRSNVAQPWRFTLGGPMHLSASSFDEYRGTDTLLTRAGWLRHIAPLPFDPAQGAYLLVGYESGEIWSPESHAILRQNGVLGLVGNTPIGIITLGTSIGDGGHRKVFLTLGRIF